MSAGIAAGLGALGSIGSGIAGAISQNNASKRASRIAEQAAGRFYDFADPDYQAMLLQLEELKSQGQLTPEMEAAILQDPSLMSQVSQDPRLQKAQMDALSTLANISNEGGMDPQAALALRESQIQTQGAARGSREANLMNAAQRGVSGSGLEFVSNQMADQNASNQAELTGLQQAGMANERDLSTLNQYADLAGTMGQRDVNLQSEKAKAQDAINQFNSQMRADVQQRNVGAKNVAQERNLGEQQRIADQNTLLRNQQQQYNKSMEQQKFDNSLSRAQGAAGISNAQIGAATAAGQNAANLWAGIGQTVGGVGSSLANYYAKKDDEDKKPIK